MQDHNQVGTWSAVQEQWNQLSKTTQNLIYVVISAAPTLGFTLLAVHLKNDYRIVAAIAAVTSGAAGLGYFAKSAYYYIKTPPQYQLSSQQEETTPLILKNPSP